MNTLRDKILSGKRAGVSFPLQSLLTRRSFECGDFYSLHLIKDWALDAGLSIVQILPLNDMGYGRSPYSSISAFAIDPIYISLHLLGIENYSRSRYIKTLNVNIKRVRQLKMEVLQKHFDSIKNEELFRELDGFAESFSWLTPYCAFRILYDRFEAQHWKEWQYGSTYSKALEREIISANRNTFYFLLWLQLVAYRQLSEVKSIYAKSNIFLKGDMPILTSGNSADVWSKNHLFIMDITAGAPPDYFNADGQNWGFPVINWSAMKMEGYTWWKERLAYIENFYHLYRIDHVLGMFRLWSIPLDAKSARFGYFYPQHGTTRKDFEEVKLKPEEFVKRELIYEFQKDKYIFYWDFYKYPGYESLPEEIKAKFYPLSNKYIQEDEAYWEQNGKEILDFLFSHSTMLPCAEDLGAVPGFVRELIHKEKIIGMDIIRWTRSLEDGHYIEADGYRENAVSALSVHDTSIALAWWQEISEDDKKAVLKLLDLEEYSTPEELLENLIYFAFSANSVFSIQLLHDYIVEKGLSHSKDIEKELDIYDHPNLHRINTPGTPESKNWGYRFPFYIEELIVHRNISNRIRKLLQKSKRIVAG